MANNTTLSEKRSATHTVIVGGGFAGIRCALDLVKNRDYTGEITLISNKHNFEYYPALYRMIIGYPSIQVTLALADIFRSTRVRVVIDPIESVQDKNSLVLGTSGTAYHYDHLVLALGSETTLFGVEGLKEHVFPFKNVHEAFDIHDRLHDFFRTCRKLEHKHVFLPDARIVVIGGGPTGVEVAAELATHADDLARRYGTHEVPEITLIEAGDRVLRAMPENLSRSAEKKLRGLGVRLLLSTSVERQDAHRVYLKDEPVPIESRLVIWTAGVKPVALYEKTGLFVFGAGGRVSVDPYLRAEGHTDIFIAGDAASTPHAGSAQTALTDGAFIAKAIVDFSHGRTPRAYLPKRPIYIVPVGGRWGALAFGTLWFGGIIPRILRGLADFRFFLSVLPFRTAVRHFFARQ